MLEKYHPVEVGSKASTTLAKPTEPTQPQIAIDMESAPDFETALRWTWCAMSHDPATIDPTKERARNSFPVWGDWTLRIGCRPMVEGSTGKLAWKSTERVWNE